MIKQVTCVLAAALLAGCASTVGGEGALAPAHPSRTAGPPAAHAKPVPVPHADNARLSPRQLETAAKKAMVTATAFRMHGSGSDGSEKIAFDMHYGATSSIGTITVRGLQAALCYVAPTIYLKGGRAFWRTSMRQAGLPAASDDSVAALLTGKWVKLRPGAAGFVELADFAVRSTFLAGAASSPDDSTFSRGPRKTIRGVRTVSFVASDDHSVVYVPASGPAFPLRIETPGQGSFELSSWNVPFSAPHPPADQVVELPS